MFIVESGESFTVVDSFTYDEHRGEGEVVVVDNLREVFENAAIDTLVWPREMITGSNGGVLGVFLKQFALHIVDNRCREENAHCTLATR